MRPAWIVDIGGVYFRPTEVYNGTGTKYQQPLRFLYNRKSPRRLMEIFKTHSRTRSRLNAWSFSIVFNLVSFPIRSKMPVQETIRITVYRFTIWIFLSHRDGVVNIRLSISQPSNWRVGFDYGRTTIHGFTSTTAKRKSLLSPPKERSTDVATPFAPLASCKAQLTNKIKSLERQGLVVFFETLPSFGKAH